MKRILFLAAAFMLILAACKKSGVSPGVYGKWELREQSGGWAPTKVFAAGNGNIYQFNRNNTYKKYDNGAVTAAGKFSVRQDNSYGPQALQVIIFDNNTSGDPISTSGDKLTIGTSVADGIESEYVKISD